MERKWHALKSKQTLNHENNQIEKQNFFEEVYQRCKATMHPKKFEFFIKSVIPTKYDHPSHEKIRKKSEIQETIEAEFIHTMRTNIFSQRKNMPYHLQTRLKTSNKENTSRIVSTPKKKYRQIIEMNNYKQFVLAKKMQDVQQRIKTDIYQSEPLFQIRKQSSCRDKIVLCKQKPVAYKRLFHQSKGLGKNSHIPMEMISVIKLPQESKTIHWQSLRKSNTN